MQTKSWTAKQLIQDFVGTPIGSYFLVIILFLLCYTIFWPTIVTSAICMNTIGYSLSQSVLIASSRENCTAK
jgi:hypothetical protein